MISDCLKNTKLIYYAINENKKKTDKSFCIVTGLEIATDGKPINLPEEKTGYYRVSTLNGIHIYVNLEHLDMTTVEARYDALDKIGDVVVDEHVTID